MIRDQLNQLKTGKGDLRRFGLVVGGVLAGLGLLFRARHQAHYLYFLGPGLGLMLLGAALPRSLKRVYLGWMALALAMGYVVSHVVLVVFFFLVVTPIGWAARGLGKQFLQRGRDPQAATYWLRRQAPSTRPAKDYEHQF